MVHSKGFPFFEGFCFADFLIDFLAAALSLSSLGTPALAEALSLGARALGKRRERGKGTLPLLRRMSKCHRQNYRRRVSFMKYAKTARLEIGSALCGTFLQLLTHSLPSCLTSFLTD